MMAGLEIKVLKPLFAKVRFWVGVAVATGGMFSSKSKKSYRVSAGLNGTAVPEPNLFGQF